MQKKLIRAVGILMTLSALVPAASQALPPTRDRSVPAEECLCSAADCPQGSAAGYLAPALSAAPTLSGTDDALYGPAPEPFVFSFQAPETSSPYILMYDATAELLLYEKNAGIRLHPASTTKLLTAQLVLDYMDPDEEITVGSELLLVPWLSSLCDVSYGDVLTVRELLYGLLLPSGNDAAYVLGVHTARRILGDPSLSYRDAAAAFCELMSRRAEELGCTDSHFVSPSGWDDPGTYSTARDMLIIARAATGYPLIREIAATPYYRFTCRSGASFEWPNSNVFLHRDLPFYREEVTGLKTGSTDEAGKCLVTLAKLNGHEVYLLVFGSESTDERSTDICLLMDAYLDQTVRCIFRIGEKENQK